MTEFSLKDHLFNREKVEYLAALFQESVPKFATRRFVNTVMQKLPSLELKQRITWIAETLESHLSAHFPEAVLQIAASLPPPLDNSKSDDDFGDFILAPLGEFVVRNGRTPEHFNLSLGILKDLTKRFSMEDAMRGFIKSFPIETLNVLTQWAEDPNYHVRRLVSESTRPLLPWSGRVDLPPSATLPLLEKLHTDKTRYVTRSVANHLNDLSKSDPTLVVKTLQQWHQATDQEKSELMWITRHSLRTLIKRGHPGALKLLGYNPAPKVQTSEITLTESNLHPGDTLEFSIEIIALRHESLVVDYAIEFAKAGNKKSSKVFKAAKFELKKGESRVVCKKHKLLAHATTYRLYPGEQRLTVQVNGCSVATAILQIRDDSHP